MLSFPGGAPSRNGLKPFQGEIALQLLPASSPPDQAAILFFLASSGRFPPSLKELDYVVLFPIITSKLSILHIRYPIVPFNQLSSSSFEPVVREQSFASNDTLY